MDRDEIFRLVKKAPVLYKDKEIINICRDKKVLDVGCAGQDFSVDDPAWMHGQISKVARELIGVDINIPKIQMINEKGFKVLTPEKLSESGSLFDIVTMADVIEHVNDPVTFLSFYSGFLKEGGRIVITTPNAHGIRNFTSIIIRNNYSVNPEHTFWFCPKTMLEVAERAGLRFSEFCWLNEYFTIKDMPGLKNRSIFLFNRMMKRLRSNFSPNFMIILEK
ncbi:MAG: class I SAM-dependent methyltransferase [Bacteroidales bacterium]